MPQNREQVTDQPLRETRTYTNLAFTSTKHLMENVRHVTDIEFAHQETTVCSLNSRNISNYFPSERKAARIVESVHYFVKQRAVYSISATVVRK